MSEKLVVVGAGGLAREVMWYIQDTNKTTKQYDILGFIESDKSQLDTMVNGFPVLGDDEWLIQYQSELNVVIAIGSGKLRKQIFDRISANDKLKFPVFISENVKYSDTTSFGKGCIICPSNILCPNVVLGDFVFINLSCTITHDVVIDKFATVNPGVDIAGNVHIMEFSTIGIGANIIQGKRIGKSTVIGGGAVVIDDIPDNCTAVGVPAKPIKFNDGY